MNRLLILVAVACGLLIAVVADAAPSTCNITGQVLDSAAQPVANATVYFNSRNTQVVNGNTIAPISKAATTDANGNLSTTALVQGVFVQITICQAQGGGCGAAITGFVPLTTSTTFANLLSGTATFTGTVLTGNLNAAGFRIFNVGSNIMSNDALSQNVSSLNNLSVPTGNYAMGSTKLTSMIAGTLSGDSLAFGLNHLNDLATASGNYPMGTNKLTGLGVGTTSGDSVAFGLNHLNDLASATGAYAMGTHKITGLATATVSGDALAFGLNPSEAHFSTTGAYGNNTNFPTANLILVSKAAVAGHFSNLLCLNQSLNGGSCTTAPIINIASTSGGTGSGPVSCNNVAQVSATVAQTLTFVAGDTISISVSTQGGTCTAPTFAIDATLVYP